MSETNHPLDAATALSAYGDFPAGNEPSILKQLLDDINHEINGGLPAIVDAYSSAVTDEERIERARGLMKVIANAGAALDLERLIEVLYFAGRQGLLRKYSLKFPAYNILEQFFVGSSVPQGPRLMSPPTYPDRRWTLFGRRINFPIGIPASVLTNNFEWLQYFFAQGFSVLTTRTVRSEYRDANPSPNWVFVPSVRAPWPLGKDIPEVVADRSDWMNAGSSDVSTSNSFGVPATKAEYWMADLQRSLRHIEKGQILIVSVMGEGERGLTGHAASASLIEDFVRVARMAESCGAEFVELNLSCPNSVADSDNDGVKPPLCYDLDQSVAVIEAVRAAIKPRTRLVAKLSYLQEPDLEVLLSRVGILLAGVAGINTMQTRVVNSAGQPTFGSRAKAGVSGVAVRNYGLDFVRMLTRLRVKLDLNFEILAMGGVTDVESFETMYDAGASVVMSASGAFANPFLADACIRAIGASLGTNVPLAHDDELRSVVMERVAALLHEGSEMELDELAVGLALPGDQATAVVESLVGSRLVPLHGGRSVALK